MNQVYIGRAGDAGQMQSRRPEKKIRTIGYIGDERRHIREEKEGKDRT